MKFSFTRTALFAVAATIGTMLFPVNSHAVNYTYHVDLNVASLLTAPTTGGYYLDFQLNGDGLPAAATNTVMLSNFRFTLGGASGSATRFQGASGDFTAGATLVLTGTNNLNELYQRFTATTTDIQFDVSTTQNGSGITPDLFLVQILDGSANSIATNAPDGVSLLTQPINGNVTLANVSAYRSTAPAGVIVSAVPEPSTWAMVALGFGLVGILARRRRATHA